MTPLHIVALCLRLVALIWVFYALNHTYGLFAYMKSDAGIAINWTAIWLSAFWQIATCVVLWFFPATIAR